MEAEKTKVISVLVENKPGVLHGVANLFRRRNFNIESITVGPSEKPDIARMTITVNGDEKTLEQVVKQLAKLIDVLKVEELEQGNFVMRELALIKVKCAKPQRTLRHHKLRRSLQRTNHRCFNRQLNR